MLEIRFHGRGGQGAVTSVELLALAAINEGKFAQGFPSFGPERRGAPVLAFLRIDDKHIGLRCKIASPLARPGPRYDARLVRFALSNDALNTSCRQRDSAISFNRRAIWSVACSSSITQGPAITSSGWPRPQR